MSGETVLLAVDQGTTSTRAIVFGLDGSPHCTAAREHAQHYPGSGWVEHDAEEIWSNTLTVCREVMSQAGLDGTEIVGVGITNQRETVVVWDRETGAPIHPAIVWQDRRTASACEALREAGHEPFVATQTGLLLDPYFSATKIAWILDNVEGARTRAEAGELAAGTIDTFLIWRFTEGAVHATDATNASRTLLFDVHTQAWSDELLSLFGVPRSLLPDVKDSADDFGRISTRWLGRAMPIGGVAGDQQAATVGQACFEPGMLKSTYGTGCFAVMNTGHEFVPSHNRLLSTVAYRLNGVPTYALEGSIFVAGAAVQWLRDGLGLIERAEETEALAMSLESNGGVYLVPAFTGLGAPYWDPHVRGALLGLTRDTGPAHFARAALESVAYQTQDLMEAMRKDGRGGASVRVDGGMVANDWVTQFLADVLDLQVERPAIVETTALGAAYLAGLGVGVYGSLDEIAKQWRLNQRFAPMMHPERRAGLLAGWQSAVAAVRMHRG